MKQNPRPLKKTVGGIFRVALSTHKVAAETATLTTDARDRWAEWLLGHFDNPVREGTNSWVAPCTAKDHHSDHRPDLRPSLLLTLVVEEDGSAKFLRHCRSQGCSFEAISEGAKLRGSDWFFPRKKGRPPLTLVKSDTPPRRPATMTIFDFAQAKGFDPKWLHDRFGIKTCAFSKAGIAIPYFDVHGRLLATKDRLHLKATGDSANPHMRWPRGAEVVAFNQPALARAQKKGVLAICEGESDCITAEYYGYPAIGLAGSQQSKTLPVEEIIKRTGIKRVLVLRDNDDPGRQLSVEIIAALHKADYRGRIDVLELPDATKDLNELHLRYLKDKRGFKRALAKSLKRLKKDALDELAEAASNVEAKQPTEEDAAEPRAQNLRNDDNENAKRFVHMHGDKVRWVPQWKRWIIWNGQRWEPDMTEKAIALARKTAESIYEEVGELKSNEDAAKARFRWALLSNRRTQITSMLALAHSDLAIDAARLDADPWVFNVRNGTIDLKTGKLRSHRREDLLTKIIDIDFDPRAKCPRFQKFLNEIFQGRRSVIAYMQRAFGLAAIGKLLERVLFILFGNGHNGKGTLLDIMTHVFGDYGHVAEAEMLEAHHHSSPNAATPDVADLAGRRLVVASETERNRSFAVAKIKRLTGDPLLRARQLYEHAVTSETAFTLFLRTNNKPKVNEQTVAIWGRLKLIQFGRQFLDADATKELLDELKQESAGILNWVVAGCLAYQHTGLADPPTVVAATKEYRRQEDPLADFIAERCVVATDKSVLSTPLFTNYQNWAHDTGVWAQMTQTQLTHTLTEERGFRKKHVAQGTLILGLSIKTPKKKVKKPLGENGNAKF